MITPIKVQAQSMGKYIQDVWIIALLLVIFQHNTTFSLPFLWIILQIIIAILVQIIFSKTGPNPIIPFIIPTSVLLILFLFHSPFWLFLVGVGISIWRVQVRFLQEQDDQTYESDYFIYYFLVFLAVLFIGFILKLDDFSMTLYGVVISGVVIFVALRLYAVWISTNKQNSAPLFHVVWGFILGLLCIAGVSTGLYLVTPFIRKVLDILLEKVVSIAIIPFLPLLEYLDKLLSKLEIKTPEETERIQSEEPTELEPTELFEGITGSGFPFEIILFALAAIVIILFVRFLLKNKSDTITTKPSVIHYLNKELEDDQEEKQPNSHISIYKVNTSLLREKYKEFEVEASFYAFHRTKSETVREWFLRMKWPVKDEFFQIYEELRYGDVTISSEKAELFLSNLEKIKITFFFEKDV